MVFIESVFALHLQILKHSPTCILPGISHVCIPAQRLVMSFIYEHNPFWFRNHVGRNFNIFENSTGHSSVVSTGSVEPAFFMPRWYLGLCYTPCSVCVFLMFLMFFVSHHIQQMLFSLFFYAMGLQHCDDLSLQMNDMQVNI